MRVMFDTNVILDAVLQRADYEAAQGLVIAAAEERLVGIVSGNSVTDIYYIARKAAGEAPARRMVADILAIFDIAPVDGDVCASALGAPMRDYEDAVLAACASREEADWIATGDNGFLAAESPVPVKRPRELLELLEDEN